MLDLPVVSPWHAELSNHASIGLGIALRFCEHAGMALGRSLKRPVRKNMT